MDDEPVRELGRLVVSDVPSPPSLPPPGRYPVRFLSVWAEPDEEEDDDELLNVWDLPESEGGNKDQDPDRPRVVVEVALVFASFKRPESPAPVEPRACPPPADSLGAGLLANTVRRLSTPDLTACNLS